MKASFLSPYNRAAARSNIRGSSQMGHSLLAQLATGEARWIVSFLEWAGGSERVYVQKPAEEISANVESSSKGLAQ